MKAAAHSRPLWLALAGGFLLLLLFVIAVRLLTGLAPAPDENAARAAERTKAHQELEAENAKKLQNYAWVDKAKGTVQIPIERAMELAMAELNSKKPTAAGPIATPAPSPAASPAASPAPAPPAPAAPPRAWRGALRQRHLALRRQPGQPQHLRFAGSRASRGTYRFAGDPATRIASRGTYALACSFPGATCSSGCAHPDGTSGSGCAHPGQHFSHASDGQFMITQRCSAGDATDSGR